MMMRNQSAHANPLLVGRELNPEHKGYLAARAVSLEIAKQAGLVSVSWHEAEQLLGFGFPRLNGGLWIPYPGADDFGRLRLDKPVPDPKKKGKTAKFLTPKEEVRPYLAPIIAEVWQDTSKPIYIVEGPIKALALIGVELVAIGLAGIRTGHKKGAPVDRLHDEILGKVKLLNRRVVILFDAGKATNKEVLLAEKKQAELYATAGAQVFVATIPLTNEGQDQGPDDFLAARGVDALRAIIDVAKPFKEAYPPEEKVSKKTQAQTIVELVQSNNIQIWFDEQGASWLSFQSGEHLEHHPLRSEGARRYIRQVVHEKAEIVPGSQAMQDAIGTLEALTPQDKIHPVFVRIGEHKDKTYLDLCSGDWSAVEIDANGWRIVAVPPVRFRRAKGMLPLPAPVKGGNVDELRTFLNTPEDIEWRFVVSWLLAALRAKGPYPIAILGGREGSAKSTTGKMLRCLLDPNACPLRSTPRDERDLAIAANNSQVVAYDNLSGIPVWLSDALCRVATGGGLSTRTLYSDNEETLLSFQRPVLLNGIDEVATRGDLADRALLITLPKIEEENRKEESDVWRDFEEARPRILGALLDVVSAGLRNLPNIKAKRLPRMADFAKWILACEESLGWEPESFLDFYADTRDQMAEAAVDGSLFARSVVNLIKEKKEWKGNASELLAALNIRTDEATKRAKEWPQTSTQAGNHIRRVASSLSRLGFSVELNKREGGTGKRLTFLGICDAKPEAQCHGVTQVSQRNLLLLKGCDTSDTSDTSLPLSTKKREESKEVELSTISRNGLQNSVTGVTVSQPHTDKAFPCDTNEESKCHTSVTADDSWPKDKPVWDAEPEPPAKPPPEPKPSIFGLSGLLPGGI